MSRLNDDGFAYLARSFSRMVKLQTLLLTWVQFVFSKIWLLHFCFILKQYLCNTSPWLDDDLVILSYLRLWNQVDILLLKFGCSETRKTGLSDCSTMVLVDGLLHFPSLEYLGLGLMIFLLSSHVFSCSNLFIYIPWPFIQDEWFHCAWN